MYQFRDPIHGFIEVSEGEKKIVDSEPFQRLRNIRQLATTYLVYHGAEHTRFGHSLGVMHLVTRVFDCITEKQEFLFRDKQKENDIATKWYRQILRLIALTHDLGHAPFSHASELLFETGMEHEDYTKKILMETEVGGYIREIGNCFQNKYGRKYKITPELIWMIYSGRADVLAKDYILPDFQFLKGFMDGELDCDKMDYLLRDSRYCGVSYGKYDLNRFISTLTVHKKESGMYLAIEKGGIQALEEFVLARYFMFIQVYFHKTRRYFDKLLAQCLTMILPGGKYPVEIREYLKWDDAKVIHCMKESKEPAVKRFLQRKTMTNVYETPAHAVTGEANSFKLIYNSLKKEIVKEKILTDEVDKAAHKLQPAFMVSSHVDEKGIVIVDRKSSKKRGIMEESLILKGIMEPINIKRIYVDHDAVEAANTLISELLKE